MNTEIPSEELKIYELISSDFNVVFDVGSRDDIDYYKIQPNCEYHLFEPHGPSIKSLKNKISKLKDSNIIVNEYGLCDENLDNQVYYSNIQSFIKHWNVKSIDSGDRYSVRKLDDYVNENKIKKIDFLKIDVEGLDYNVLVGGLSTITEKDIVSFLQIECSGSAKQYVDLLPNFNFYVMIEPRLLEVINNLNETEIDFNKSLVKLSSEVVYFMDNTIRGTGAGSNLFGINKKIDDNKLIEEKELIIKIHDNN